MSTSVEDERLVCNQALLELRTLQRVADELSRSLDLDVVLGRCLDLAMEVAHAAAGVIYLVDPARATMRRVVVRNLPDSVAAQSLPVEMVLLALNANSLQMPLAEAQDRPYTTAAWQMGLRLVVMLALRLDHRDGEEELIGFLAVHFRESSPLPTSTMQTLEAIARQEAMAIVNARTHQVAERSSRMAHGLREFAERALTCTDDAELYRLIINSALKLTGNDRGLISRPAGGTVRVMAAEGIDSDLVGLTMPDSTPYLAEALTERGTVVREDASEIDPESMIGRLVHGKGTRSFMHSAMWHGDRAVGLLFAGSGEPRRYEPEEREAFQILAAVAGEAMERVSALERLAEEKRRLDAVLEHLPIIVSVLGPGGELLHINAAGRAAAQWMGRGGPDWRQSIGHLQSLDSNGQAVHSEDFLIMQAFRGEQPPPRERTLITPDGKRRHVLAVAAPLRGRDGSVEAVVSGVQDVTSLREMADAKDHFLRIASHELRSPLTALRASTSLLEMDPAAAVDGERRTVLLSRVQRQVDRLTRLVEQLLDSVRLNATEPSLALVETDLQSLCREVIDAQPGNERVALESDGPLVGHWDPLRLEQVLSNLLSNAARYSAQASPIRVRLRRDGAQAVVEVIDRGIGIPPDQRELLFTPFFRASNAALQSRGGLGLGLHIAHEIVRRHGGSLSVHSTLGEGSTFIVELPVDRAPPAG